MKKQSPKRLNALVKLRHHRAAERLLERLDKLLLTVCLDVVSAGCRS